MARDGSGVHSLPGGYEAVTGQTITATQHNAPLEDLSAEITASLPRSGDAAMTGNLAMGGNKVTGLGTPTNGTDAVTKTYADAIAAAGVSDGDYGNITVSSSGTAWTIDAGVVTSAMMANMAQSTFKGRAAGAGTGVPVDLTATQATAILNSMVADSGSGGTKGLVPAPAAGDAVKVLLGDADFHLAEDIDATKSLGSGGYIKLPGGFTVQWGNEVNVAYNTARAISFPSTFGTSCFGVVGNFSENHNQSLGASSSAISFYNESTTGVTLEHGANETLDVFWIAIGY